jgi:hypothetical protein
VTDTPIVIENAAQLEEGGVEGGGVDGEELGGGEWGE